MTRRTAMYCAAWLVAVGGVWIVATMLLTIWAMRAFDGHSIGGFIAPSATRTAVICVAVGGPATAVALWLRQRTGAGQPAFVGLAMAGLAFVVLLVVVFNSGLATLTAVAPVLAIIAVEVSVAFIVRAKLVEP